MSSNAFAQCEFQARTDRKLEVFWLTPSSRTRNTSPLITTPIVPTPASPLKAIHAIEAAKVVTIEIAIEPVMTASMNASPKESVVPKAGSIHSWATTIPAAIARVMSVNEPERLFLETSTMPTSLRLTNAWQNQRASQSNQSDCQEFLHSSHDPSSFFDLVANRVQSISGEIRFLSRMFGEFAGFAVALCYCCHYLLIMDRINNRSVRVSDFRFGEARWRLL